MSKRLILAEKPAVARDLARALGVRSSGGVFEDERYVITWCIGHLVELCEPHEYNEAWRRWQLQALPMLPPGFKLRPVKTSLRQWRVVKEQLRRRDLAAVINACDAGREGELIFRFCYELAGCRLPVERLWISSLTDQAIKKGFASLRPGRELEPLAAAARCRAEADWLVGMNATRAVTLWRRGAGNTLFSLGRVQTPTLGLLVSREHAINRFVPRDYFEVHAQLRPAPATQDAAPFTAVWQAPDPGPARGDKARDKERDKPQRRIAQRPLAEAVVARDRPAPAVVERVDKKAVREPPPLLFDLGSLQRTANRRFGWTAQRTLSLAQALYEEHKLLTYPRTDSRHLPSDLIAQLPRTFAALAAQPVYRDFAEQAGHAQPPRRVFQDQKVTDHHAIIPTPSEQTAERLARLSSDERSLLDLVSRRFLAAFFPDAEFEQTSVVVRLDAVAPPAPAPTPDAPDPDGFVTSLPPPPDRYHARGRVRVRAGWQEVAGLDEKKASRGREPGTDETGDEGDDDEAAQVLPPLAAGQTLGGDFVVVAKQTRPPPRYTEATLLGAMESAGRHLTDEALREAMRDSGLGTPATRASIIETLVDRRYILRRGKQVLPTPLGIDLIDKLPHRSLTSAQLTGEWEARLSRMARGEEPRPAFMADIGRFVGELVESVRAAPPPPPLPAVTTPAAGEERGSTRSPPARSRSRGRAARATLETDSALAQPPPRLPRSRGRRKPTAEAPAAPKKSARAKKQSPATAAPAPVESLAMPIAAPPRRAPPPAPPRPAVPPVARPAPGTLVSPPLLCPRCRAGRLLWGRRAWGCSNFHQCPLVVPYEADGRARSEQDLRMLLTQGGRAVASP